jgi:hypothetical protein
MTAVIGPEWALARYRDPEICRRALAFARSHPWAPQYLDQCPALAALFRNHRGLDNAPGLFGAAVSTGPKLADFLADSGIPRPLCRIRGPVLSVANLNGLRIMRGVPAQELGQWIPGDIADQEGLLVCMTYIASIGWRIGDLAPAVIPLVMLQDYLGRVPGGDAAHLIPAWAVREIGRGLAGPRGLGGHAIMDAIRHLDDTGFFTPDRFRPDWTLARACRAADEWMQARLRDPAALAPGGAADRDIDVSPLPRDVDLGMGARAVALVTARDLHQEGQAMLHCVGDYVGEVQAGSRIYSLRLGDRRVATAEVRATFATSAARVAIGSDMTVWQKTDLSIGRWQIVQIKAARNGRPDRGVELLFRRWIAAQPAPKLFNEGARAAGHIAFGQFPARRAPWADAVDRAIRDGQASMDNFVQAQVLAQMQGRISMQFNEALLRELQSAMIEIPAPPEVRVDDRIVSYTVARPHGQTELTVDLDTATTTVRIGPGDDQAGG